MYTNIAVSIVVICSIGPVVSSHIALGTPYVSAMQVLLSSEFSTMQALGGSLTCLLKITCIHQVVCWQVELSFVALSQAPGPQYKYIGTMVTLIV